MPCLSRQVLRQFTRLFEIPRKENPTLCSSCLLCCLSPSPAALWPQKSLKNRLFLFHSLTIFETQTPLDFKHFVKTASPWCKATTVRMSSPPVARCTLGVIQADMADAKQTYRSVPSCDHQALKECLDRNSGDRSKCMKEWEEFQRSCAENNRWSKVYCPSTIHPWK